MAKLRNGSTDIEKFAQWLGRKCRNHHPLEELSLSRAPKANMYSAKGKGDVALLPAERNKMLYRAGGRAFVIEVKEVDPAAFEGQELVPVGF